jgi:hypothetical protein
MNASKTLLTLAALFSISTFVNAEPDAKMKSDAQAVNAACTAEAATAGCGQAVVGKGLLKCIHAYKEANKGFTVSAGCKAAIQQLSGDKKAGK